VCEAEASTLDSLGHAHFSLAIGQFVLFGLGMGAGLAVLTVATAGFGDGLIRRARALG
jgi:hypothetical protein